MVIELLSTLIVLLVAVEPLLFHLVLSGLVLKLFLLDGLGVLF